MTAQIIYRHTIFVTLLLSNGFYGVGEFNDETHQIVKLWQDDIPNKELAINITKVFSFTTPLMK